MNTVNVTDIKNKIESFFQIRINAKSVYFIGFTLYLTAAFLKTTMATEYISMHALNYLAYASMGVLVFKWFFFTRFTRNQLVIESILIFVAGLSWLKAGEPLAFYMSLLVITARGQKFDVILNWYVILATRS